MIFGLLAWTCSGCGGAKIETHAGGKPISHWIEATHDPDPKVRKSAATKLGNIGPSEPEAFPAVMALLKDRVAVVRCGAILAVGKFGSSASEAITILTDLRDHDRDAKVRTYATATLEKLQTKG
jgi:HEAT repeat protein